MAYDYIVIGAGSAGCVMANRLSEDGHTVLLLEAGTPDKKTEVKIPAAFSALFKTEVDWNYETTPQPELKNRKIYTPRGKMLGGSSSINAMIVQRGHPNNYNQWAEMGNESWSWDDCLPYFKKLENNERFTNGIHGQGGPLNVTDLRDPNEISEAFVQAAQEAGFGHRADFNDGEQIGFGLFQVS
ncbi:MAG: GMC family oxidoreductase N-terminal domain-containing protein, partial [Chloroflexota bacterium]